jgi:hypothetical protein
MPANRNGEAGTSPNRSVLSRHVEIPEFTPPALVRQAHPSALRLGVPFSSASQPVLTALMKRRP